MPRKGPDKKERLVDIIKKRMPCKTYLQSTGGGWVVTGRDSKVGRNGEECLQTATEPNNVSSKSNLEIPRCCRTFFKKKQRVVDIS